MGKPSVVGCERLGIDFGTHRARFGDSVLSEGDWIAIDGDKGAIYLGARTIVRERPAAELAEVGRWQQQSRSA
jgi:pyruvate,orthophosphate dikinase